jgi:DNA-binding HxlR family transcriptional regulator
MDRSYGEACPVAHALDAIGDRWALLVVRELRLGPRRYSDLQSALPGAGPNVLTRRLRDLETGGVLHRRTLPPPASAVVYELTEWGADLEPVFRALAKWGIRSPVPRKGHLTADSMMLGLRTFFSPGRVEPWTALYEFRLDRNVFRLRVVDGRLDELTRGEADRPDTVVAGSRAAVQSVLEGKPIDDAVSVTGDLEALERLLAATRPVTRPAPTGPRRAARPT